MEKVFIKDENSSPETSYYKEIPAYVSSDAESERSEEETQVAKKQKKMKNWLFLKEFSTEKEAVEFIKSEETWSRSYTRVTDDGQKIIYRCNKVKKRGPQCNAELYLLYVSDGSKVMAYQTDSEHNHDSIGATNYGIREKTKEEINKLADLHMKPKAILAGLAKMKGITLPTKTQLCNYLLSYKATKSKKSTVSLGELEQWLVNHTTVPEDENEVFAISYQISDEDQPSFRFTLSTKALLKLILLTDTIHADTTFKMIWQGFSILVLGVTDKARKFHPLCLEVISDECQEAFQAMFQGLRDKVMQLYDHIMKPRVFVCDANRSLQNAFSEVFETSSLYEETTIRMCWGHVKRNIQKNIDKNVSKEDQKLFMTDVEVLHNATSPEVFNVASQAFLEKWRTREALVKYIEEEWITKNTNWYMGAAPTSPATNHGLECCIRNIKKQNTVRERLPLPQFLSVVTDVIAQWSKENSSVPEALTIELKQWAKAYGWAKKDIKTQIIASDSSRTVYLISDGENAEGIKYNDGWQTFDEFKEQKAAFQKTILPNSDWQKGLCDCLEYFEKYVCVHILGLAIRLKLTTPPPEAKILPRKPGRPTKRKASLIAP